LSSAESAGEIIIYNVLGQEMGTIETSPGIIEYQYDMSAFPPGNYVITFISNNTVLERKKFVLTDF
jgi:hypothetical protein